MSSSSSSENSSSSSFSAAKFSLLVVIGIVFIFVSNGFWSSSSSTTTIITPKYTPSDDIDQKTTSSNTNRDAENNNNEKFHFNNDQNDPSNRKTEEPSPPPSVVVSPPSSEGGLTNADDIQSIQNELTTYLQKQHKGKMYLGEQNEFKSLVPIESLTLVRRSISHDPAKIQYYVKTDVTKLPPLTSTQVSYLRYIQMLRDVPAGLGLTTQLLTYLHLIAAAQFAKGTRVLIFPSFERTGWFTLINMSATTFPGHAIAYVASNLTEENIRTTSTTRDYASAKKFMSGKTTKWTRENAQLFPVALGKKIYSFYSGKASGRKILVVPEMYKRYPFAIEPVVNFGKMVCGLVFHSKIERLFLTIMDKLEEKVKFAVVGENSKNGNSNNEMKHFNDIAFRGPDPWSVSGTSPDSPPYFIPRVRYISLHLRLEGQDSVAFRRKAPTATQLSQFLSSTIASKCRKYKTPNVFVASGPLPKEFEAVLKSGKYEVTPGVYMNIFRKENVLRDTTKLNVDEESEEAFRPPSFKLDPFFHEGQTAIRWEKYLIYPTNTKMAAVDALVLQHGVAAVMTAFSSLTSLIFARRCYDGPRCLGKLYGEESIGSKHGPSTTYLYDIGSDGKMTKAKPFKCGYRMGELIRGGGAVDPPQEDDLFLEGARKPGDTAFA